MAIIDLKPLTKEAIQEQDLNPHDLWVVKINDDLYGPFELAPLKQEVKQDPEAFVEAFASRLNLNYWEPFYTQGPFMQYRPKTYGPYWLIKDGLKSGPFSKKDLEAKLLDSTLGFTDVVSLDEGYTWQKLYEVDGFTHHQPDASKLPFSPSQDEFDKSKIHVLNIIEFRAGRHKAGEELAGLAIQKIQAQGKTHVPKTEDIPVVTEPEVHISGTLKYAIPAAVITASLLMTAGYFFINSSSDTLEDKVIVITRPRPQAMAAQTQADENPSQPMNPQLGNMPRRNPASVQRFTPPPSDYNYPQDSQYPTHVETHQHDPSPVEQEPMDTRADAYQDQQPRERDPHYPGIPEEHSLVGKMPEERDPRDDGQPLDAAMNGSQPEKPVVEEASDF